MNQIEFEFVILLNWVFVMCRFACVDSALNTLEAI